MLVSQSRSASRVHEAAGTGGTIVTISRPGRIGSLILVTLLVASACSSAATAGPTTPSTPVPASAAATAAASSAAVTPPVVPTGNITLQGAGATFPAPLYGTWFEAFSAKYTNIQVDYQANGSGAGIKAITQQTVDFGASDAPMKDEEIAALPSGAQILHIPTALGAVVVIYNLPGVDSVQLDSANVAGIYLGTITKWNDPAIAANNPGVNLPATDILVVHRSDGSGTTNAFTTYLDTVSPDWHSKVGKGKEVKWPTGIGAQGNDGVAGGVKQTPGAIGYVELSYATTAKLASAKLKNADGQYVPGSTAGVTAAAAAAVAAFPADFRQAPIINGAGAQTYPIASYTFLLVYKDQKDASKGQALVAFIQWALTEGQGTEESLGYAPLPAEIQAKALAELHSITSGGSPIWP
jgi:phosphate transport system substrate-binding protein